MLFRSQMGLGHTDWDVEGYPGKTSYVFSEEAARGFYRRWAELTSGLSWAEMLERDAKVRAERGRAAEAVEVNR